MAISDIEWTNYVQNLCLLMFGFVARFAQRFSVANRKSKFWIISERFNVMRLKVSSASIAASKTNKAITCENVIPPALILAGESLSTSFGYLAIFVGMALFAARYIAFPFTATHFCSGFSRVLDPKPSLPSLRCGTYQSLCMIAMFPSLECRWPPFGSADLTSGIMRSAFRGETVKSSFIPAELSKWNPFCAPEAPLQSIGHVFNVFTKWYSNPRGCKFYCSVFSLRHVSILTTDEV